ncbi:aminoacyl-tRNA hydrolase [Pedobacter sp. BS3]|uniref:alternative ribosome rescue aminoacyl-tRNA hydrolase ArfB n=1 Tax=Pedobacter sp. BS3 TaxID=2567937 RepID=UPI0011EF841D|nr:alternative ribosome rescue aminoacyl-tRNA hydrolase ArfB [Pedobacter sp. BS3]TZF82563.1 aminoacyl-tRNA hydrolase [Pedobacter sp. BS3]
MHFTIGDLQPNITYKTSRSGGKGGQHVNKVSSKVELNFDISQSSLFTPEQKQLITDRLANRISSTGMLQIICQQDRSQLANKQRCQDKLIALLHQALKVNKSRKATKPKRSAIESRLEQKRKQALKKMGRRSDFFD